MEVILVRHPETIANCKNLFFTEKDYDYTSRGQIEFNNIIKELKEFEYVIYSSPFERALKIAQMLSNNVIIDSRLKEMDFGLYKGKSIEDIKNQFPDDYIMFKTNFHNYTFPGGESYINFQKRVIDSFENIIHKGDNVIIVTHGGVINLILQNYFNIKKFWPKTGSIIKLKLIVEDD